MRRAFLIIVFLFALALAPAAASAAERDCPEGAQCFDLPVPLDRLGAVPGTIDLPVTVEEGTEPVLLILGGGPGQGMVQHAEGIFQSYASLFPGYRFAVLDQRGTGLNAIDCRRLQQAKLSDLTVPPPGAVESCGRQMGNTRGFFTTGASATDLEHLRLALGLPSLAIMGTSYGTYVAERYARAYPDYVSRLILDSVVPQENVGPLFTEGMKRSRFVLKQLCQLGKCRGVTRNATADLARLVRKVNRRPISGKAKGLKVRIDGPALYDSVVILASFLQKDFLRLPRAVRNALDGRKKKLVNLVATARLGAATSSLRSLSWGAHEATFCGDMEWPWGPVSSGMNGRLQAARLAAGRLPRSSVYPFDQATAAGNGALVACSRWPQTGIAKPPAPGPLPAVPTLILTGAWDLSTPVVNARKELARSSTAELVVVPYVGHSAFGRARCTLTVVRRFLTDQPVKGLCSKNRPNFG